jgi:hypothetical protein
VNAVVVPSPTVTGIPVVVNALRLPLATALPEQSVDAKILTTEVAGGAKPMSDGVVDAPGEAGVDVVIAISGGCVVVVDVVDVVDVVVGLVGVGAQATTSVTPRMRTVVRSGFMCSLLVVGSSVAVARLIGSRIRRSSTAPGTSATASAPPLEREPNRAPDATAQL